MCLSVSSRCPAASSAASTCSSPGTTRPPLPEGKKNNHIRVSWCQRHGCGASGCLFWPDSSLSVLRNHLLLLAASWPERCSLGTSIRPESASSTWVWSRLEVSRDDGRKRLGVCCHAGCQAGRIIYWVTWWMRRSLSRHSSPVALAAVNSATSQRPPASSVSTCELLLNEREKKDFSKMSR